MSISFKRLKKILKPEYYKQFNHWIKYQTTKMDSVYEDDFLRWIQGLPNID